MAERKKFVDVELPIIGSTMQVLGTPKELAGRTIKLDLSRKMRGKGVMLTVQMVVHEDKLYSVPKRLELVKSYIRRIIRKRTDTVEDSFKVTCTDITATIKPFLITRKRVSRAVRRNLRNTAREFLIGYAKEKSYHDLFDDILSGTLQRSLLPKLKKVYPLAFCDIRVFESKELAQLDVAAIIAQAAARAVEEGAHEPASLEEAQSQDEEDSEAEDTKQARTDKGKQHKHKDEDADNDEDEDDEDDENDEDDEEDDEDDEDAVVNEDEDKSNAIKK